MNAPDNTTVDLKAQLPNNKDENNLSPSFVRAQYDRGTRALRKQQYEYVRNLSFLDGQQWLLYNTALNRWSQIPKNPDRVQATFNILRHNVRVLMSKLLSRELIFEVLPGDSDSASVRGAQTSEAIVNTLHDDEDWENIRTDMAMTTLLGGTGILAIDWDAQAGQLIDYLPITGEPFGTGDIEVTALSIAEVAWEPGTKIAEKGNWWIRAQALPPKLVQQTYNLPKLPAADVQGMVSPIATMLSQSANASPDMQLTLVITYYERPNPLRPKGAIVTLVNNDFVSPPVDWYFPFTDRLNMSTARETHVPGQAAGETVFSDACRVQKSYNDAWSNLLEHHKNTGSARMLIPEGSLDGIEDISDLPGEIIPFNEQAGKPEYMNPPVMPEWWMNGVTQIREELEDMLSVHDVSKGQAPANADSGLALSILAEQDNTPIGNLTREVANTFEWIACLALQIYAANVKETRTAKINKTSNPEAVEWTGQSLSGQFDVKIPMDQIMPRSHAADFAMATSLFNQKIITDPRDFIRIAQQPGYKNILEVVDADANKAERENHLMTLGRICIPADYDDHRRHIDVHNRFRKTTRYDSLDPESRSVIDEHIQAHEMLAAEQAAQQEAKMGVSPGLANVPTANAQEPILQQPFAQAPLGITPQTPPILPQGGEQNNGNPQSQSPTGPGR